MQQYRSPGKKGKKDKTDVELGIHIPDVEVSTDTPTFDNFCEGQKAIMDAFIKNSKDLYQKTMENLFAEQKMKSELYQSKLLGILEKKNLNLNALLGVFDSHKIRLDNVFTILKQFALWFYRLKRKRAIFIFWKKYSDRRRYYAKMTVYSRNYYKRNLLRGLTRNWKLFKNDQVKVRETTRWTIKLSKEIEVLKTEYTGMIYGLQELYQKRMEELAEEEEQHKEMFAKFSGLTEIKKLESSNIH